MLKYWPLNRGPPFILLSPFYICSPNQHRLFQLWIKLYWLRLFKFFIFIQNKFLSRVCTTQNSVIENGGFHSKRKMYWFLKKVVFFFPENWVENNLWRAQISRADTEVLLDFDQAVSVCPPQHFDLHFECRGFSGVGCRGEVGGGNARVNRNVTEVTPPLPVPPFRVPQGLESCRVGGHPRGPSWGVTSPAWASDPVAASDRTQTVQSCWRCLNTLGHILLLQLLCSALIPLWHQITWWFRCS